jgi:hypothetical protein
MTFIDQTDSPPEDDAMQKRKNDTPRSMKLRLLILAFGFVVLVLVGLIGWRAYEDERYDRYFDAKATNDASNNYWATQAVYTQTASAFNPIVATNQAVVTFIAQTYAAEAAQAMITGTPRP